MIEWVNSECVDWSAQVRQRDGLLPLAELATYDYLHNPAGLTDRAQELSAAVFRMRATPAMLDAYRVLVAHYLFCGPAKAKATIVARDKNEYWDRVQTAHAYLAARIDYPMAEVG